MKMHPPALYRACSIFLASLIIAPQVQSQAPPSAKRDKSFGVAVLNSSSVSSQADFLSASLSSAGFTTLERADLSLVTQEGALTDGKLKGALTSADVLVLVESITVDNRSLLATRVVGRDDGQIHSTDLRGIDDFEVKWTEVVTPVLNALASAARQTDQKPPTISLRAIREEFVAGKVENDVLSAALGRLVGAELSRRPSLRLLERNDLSLVQFERFLTKVDPENFEPADFQISGTFRRESDKCHYDLLVEARKAPFSAHLESTAASADLADIANSMAAKLISYLEANSEKDANAPAPSPYRPDESAKFAAEAERFLRLGLHQSAAAFSNTAYLLDTNESASIAHLSGCAALLAALPGVRGKGIDLSKRITPVDFNNPTSPLRLYDAITEDPSQDPDQLPGREQWEALALAAERAVEVDRRERLRPNPKMKDGDYRLRMLKGGLAELVPETLNRVRRRFGAKVPPFEFEMLRRIKAAADQLEQASAQVESHQFNFFSLYDSLYLASTFPEAVDRIRELLYGPAIVKMREGSDRDLRSITVKVEIQRGQLFTYFEHLGFDPENGDDSSQIVDESLLAFPFVAALSGGGSSYEETFDAAVASAPEEFRPLAEFDKNFRLASSTKPGDERNKVFVKVREAIVKNSGDLKKLGMLEVCAFALANLESGRKVPPADETGAFWKKLHRDIYSDGAWTSGRLSEKFLGGYFNGFKWVSTLEERPASFGEFLESMDSDLAANDNPFSLRNRELVRTRIKKEREELSRMNPTFVDVHAKNALDGVPEEETLVLDSAYWVRYPPVLATCLAEEGFYLLRHGSSQYNESSSLVRFDIGNPIAEVKAPDELRDLTEGSIDEGILFDVQRVGALEVGPERISMAFPGGTAVYDRRTEKWSIRAEPFLENRIGMAILGDCIASYAGVRSFDSALPVQGLYLTSRETFQHSALIDTTRRPPKSFFDQSKDLFFHFPPLPINRNQFLIGIRGYSQSNLWKGTLEKEDSKIEYPPATYIFDPGYFATVNGTKSNGYVNVAAMRKAGNPKDGMKGEGILQIGAFAVGPDGAAHWLLDTGTIPLESKPSDFASQQNVRMLADEAKPLFHFPADFQIHRGSSNSKPVVHYDGKRLLLLTNQLTSDGRRLLYYWKDESQRIPKRIALRFNGFPDETPDKKFSGNIGARNTVRSIFQLRDFLCFEFDLGFFYCRTSQLESPSSK